MKIVSLLKAREGLSRPDFQAWLITAFGPDLLATSPSLGGLIIRPAVEIVPTVLSSGYTPPGPRYPWPAYDAVVQMRFDAPDGFERRFGDGDAGRRLREALEARCALQHSYEVEPTLVIGPDSLAGVDQGAAFVSPVVWKPMPAERAARYWRDHARIVHEVHIGTARYERNPVVRVLEGPKVDGLVDFAFKERSDFAERFYPTEEGVREHAADVAQFLADAGRVQVGPAVQLL